jgi:iron complex outermembrane recepter protein
MHQSSIAGRSAPGKWIAALLFLVFVGWLAPPSQVAAQATATIQGTVVAEHSGSPIAGVTVYIPESPYATHTDAGGRFRLLGVPPGRHTVVFQRLGLVPASEVVEVAAAAPVTIVIRMAERALLVPAVVVSATREARRLAETAATVGVISGEDLAAARPTHPSAVMSQVPGVWVNVTGGEGHMTAIRQPQTTKPVYLFLEDGVPTRSTGFFNHNALYEVNLPQAGSIEVLKGPATALYGSDAIGGVINVETRGPSFQPSMQAFAEAGAFGYSRLLLSGSDSWRSHGMRADLNLTRTAGWRDATGYNRQSATLRWDSYLGDRASLRTLLTGSRIQQQTAGSSALPLELYREEPRLNLAPISLRNVDAVRLSSAAEVRGEKTLVSVTPFLRWNEMELLPNWSLTFDPTILTTGHSSVGLLARARRDLEAWRTRVIAGFDLDHSPGGRIENRIAPGRHQGVFTDYTLGEVVYDYDVVFNALSPYAQVDANPTGSLHLTAGLRYDRIAYDYSSRLAPLATGRWRRPADVELRYRHLSPKLGAAYDFGPSLNVYGNRTHGFRAPSEGQLFRQGSAASTVDLRPVTADSHEIGARGDLVSRLGYSLAAYRMRVENDILGYLQPDGTPETQNAGETRHHGVEGALSLLLTAGLRADLSYSRARHHFVRWSPRPEVDYAGNEMDSAPKTIANTRLTYTPGFLPPARIALEWNRIGAYWLDADNTHSYAGHDLLNLQVAVPLPYELEVVGRVANLANVRYAESATFTRARGQELAPGLPRTAYVGVQYRWER